MAPGFRDQGVWVMRSPDWIARESEGRRVERRAVGDERSTCGGGRVVVSVVAGLAGLTFKGAAEARGPVRVSPGFLYLHLLGVLRRESLRFSLEFFFSYC